MFIDPDGHPWEVAHNPFWTINPDGSITPLTADLILTNARVATMDGARRTCEAVAVEGGRIAAVGSARDVADLRGPATRVVDVDGGMVLPGFQDAHCHLGESGHQMTLCDLADAGGPDAYGETIAAYAAAHPDRPVVAGGGWAMSDFPGGVAQP